MRLGIRWRLILAISMPLLVLIAVLIAGDYLRARAAARMQLEALVTENASNAASQLDSRLEAIRQLADSTAEFLTARPNIQPVQLASILRTHLRQNNLVYATVIAFEPGMVGDSHDRLAPALVRTPRGPRSADLERLIDYTSDTYPWYAQVKATQAPLWTDPYAAPYLGEQRVITYSAPFYLGEVFRGVVAISIRLDNLQHLIARAARQVTQVMPAADNADLLSDAAPTSPATVTLPQPEYAVLDHRGYVLASTDDKAPADASILQTATVNNMADVVTAMHDALDGSVQALRTDQLNTLMPRFKHDKHHWIAFAGISSTGWVFSTSLGESVVMDPIMKRLRTRAEFLLVGMLGMMSLVLFLAVRMSRPIEQMADAVKQLAAGDLDTRVTGVRRRDEIGELADGFNSMVEQLREHVDELTRQSAEREKVDSELRIARQIQNDLLPQHDPPFPDVDEFELCGINVPARHVAGDFYDYFFAPNNHLYIVIADVSGKGVPAAMLMAVTRTIIRNLAMTGISPAEIIDAANRMLVEDTNAGLFVTMMLIQYDTETGRLVYCNAGHPTPFAFGNGDGVCELGAPTAPVLGVAGVDVFGPIVQREAQLHVGQTLLLYTDGVTEARSPGNMLFGETRLRELLEHCDSDDPAVVCRHVIAELDDFQNGHTADDITLVALRRRR